MSLQHSNKHILCHWHGNANRGLITVFTFRICIDVVQQRVSERYIDTMQPE